MASRKIEDCDPILIKAWQRVEIAWDARHPDLPKPFLTCTFRSNDEQNQLFNQGRINKKLKVTNAKAGQSPHNYQPSLAFDVAFITLSKSLDWSPNLFKLLADLLKEIDERIEWGGEWSKFKDLPHFQVRDWKGYLK